MIPFISQLPTDDKARWITALNRTMPDEQVVDVERLSSADKRACQFAIVANPDPKALAEFENLTWLHSLWAGVEHLMAQLADSPLQVVRLIDPVLSQTMAEAVLAWSLYLHRDMPRYAQQQRQQVWLQHRHVPASERRIGILGLGELGKASAKKLQQQGFQVMGWSRSAKNMTNISSYCGEQGLTEMVSQSDILVCLLPLTAATHGIVNQTLLANLPKGSALINFARGGIVDTKALLCALNTDHLSHAVLDVFEHEPLSASSELWQHSDITILPHISAATNLSSACEIVAKNINEYRRTGLIPTAVNKAQGY
ncbi:MAG: 2-hydroxyacid dehydrogenase [Cognaticolwellia sp.]